MENKEFKPKVKAVTISKCAEDCVWRCDKYINGCGKYTDISGCKGKQSYEEAKKQGLI